MIYNNKSRTLCNPVRVLKNELINYLFIKNYQLLRNGAKKGLKSLLN